MSEMKNIAIILARVAEGEEVTTEERDAAITYFQGLQTVAHRKDYDKPTTVTLRDGRHVDVFPTGIVHVYSTDNRSGVELALPDPGKPYTPVGVITLG